MTNKPKGTPPVYVTLALIPRRPHGVGQPFIPERVIELDFWERFFASRKKYGDPRVEVLGVKAKKADLEAFLKSLDPPTRREPEEEPEEGESAQLEGGCD